jgi:Uroporphyrinogen decarboxylase (URO-D)
MSVDWIVSMAKTNAILGSNIGVQGKMDPGVLFGSQDFIRDRIHDTIRKAGNHKHIMNLGHGILPTTPEENAAFFKNGEAVLLLNVNNASKLGWMSPRRAGVHFSNSSQNQEKTWQDGEF